MIRLRASVLPLLAFGVACDATVILHGSPAGGEGGGGGGATLDAAVGSVSSSTGVTTGGGVTSGSGPPPKETTENNPPPPDDPNDPCDVTTSQACQGVGDDIVFGPIGPGTSLHVVGVYETHSEHASSCHPAGPFTVHVTAPGSHVLALSAYEPVYWQVSAGPGATIERVIIDGYHEAYWLVPPGTVVEEWTYEGSGQYLEAGAHTFAEASSIIAYAEASTGATFASYQGAYCMSSALID